MKSVIFRKFSLSKLSVLFILLVLIWRNLNLGFWEKPNQLIRNDIIIYYSYLPAFFIEKDLTLSFTHNSQRDFTNKYWSLQAPNGGRVFKMSMGMAFLYAPFFLMSHAYAHILGYTTDGFSMPYRFGLLVSCIAYLTLGIIFLRKLLLRYFSEQATALTLLAVVLGTNLFNYATVEAPMSHAYNFTLITIFVYLTDIWYSNPKYWRLIIIGILGGLISLIRPTNIIVFLMLFFWGIEGMTSLKERFKFWTKHYYFGPILLLTGFVVWMPQLIYWKTITGQYLYYSYGENERFFFSHPRIIKTLFSYRKGWLLYTPMMFIAIIGIIISYNWKRQFFMPVALFLAVAVYIVSSWWAWWYGGSFGQRPLIDYYGIFSIPFALMIDWINRKRKLLKLTFYSVFIMLVALNQINALQYKYAILHWDSMSKKAYWATFLKLHYQPGYDRLLIEPDYNKAAKGIDAGIDHEKAYDRMIKSIDKKKVISEIEADIRSNIELLKPIKEKAKNSNISTDSLIKSKANIIYENNDLEKYIRTLLIMQIQSEILDDSVSIDKLSKEAYEKQISLDSMIHIEAIKLFEIKKYELGRD